MNKREIVIESIEHHQPPIIPYQLSFSHDLEKRLKKEFPYKRWINSIGNYMVTAGNGTEKKMEGNRRQDQFGVIWKMDQKGDFGIVENCLIKSPNLEGHAFDR